jgi:hypothetical protein
MFGFRPPPQPGGAAPVDRNAIYGQINSAVSGFVNDAANSFNQSAVPSEAPSGEPGEQPRGELDEDTWQEKWFKQLNPYLTEEVPNTDRSGQVFSNIYDPSRKSYQEQLYGQSPGMDAYYDNAFNEGMDNLNTQFRAKGFGSTAHSNALSRFGAGLYADKAKNEADYRLRSAQGADAGWKDQTMLFKELSEGADSKGTERYNARTNRFNVGSGAANTAGNSRYNNQKLGYDMQNDFINKFFDAVSGGQGDIIAALEALQNGQWTGNVSAAEDNATGAANDTAQGREDLATLYRGGKPK